MVKQKTAKLNRFTLIFLGVLLLIIGFYFGRALASDNITTNYGCNQIARFHQDLLMKKYKVDFDTTQNNPKAELNERAGQLNGKLLEICNTDPSNLSSVAPIASSPRDKIIEYVAGSTDTMSHIAVKFNISKETIRLENGLTTDDVYEGQTLRILPVTGVSHKAVKGDTIHSLAKKYKTDAQKIADYPYNKFADNESFTLIPGEILIIPDGMK